MLESNSMRDLLSEANIRYGTAPFLIQDESLGTVSYSDTYRFALGLEQQLDTLGIPPGAPVATLFHNSGLAALLFLGVMASRRLFVPLNPISTNAELEYMLDKSNCAAVIVDPGHALGTHYGRRQIILVPNHYSYYAERRAEGESARYGLNHVDRVEVFVGEVVFTSGSTGRPKGVVLSESSLIANALALGAVYDLRAADRFLTVCPLFHNSGQVFTTLSCLLAGGSTAPVKSATGMINFWTYIDKYRANWAFGMVSFLALLLTRPEGPTNPGTIRGLLTGGSAIDASLIKTFESRFRVPVRTVYGLTETASISTCEFLDPSPRSFGSSGRPLPICEVRIETTSAETREADDTAALRKGEILISGLNVFHSYIGEPELTSERKLDGWVHTGDVGYFDANGNLFVVDRLDSMLIVGGENVYPAEVELLCALLPGAAQIVLTGVDHAIWGKELVLVYRPASDAVAPTRSWRRILREHIAEIKIPQRYVSLDELGLNDFPRMENGKLNRQAIAVALATRSAPSGPISAE